MDPLNQQERKKAFINFLIFFSITAALIIAAVLFSVEVPFKQNEQLREQIVIVEKERDFSEKFATKMGETMNWLDSVNKNEVTSPEILDNKIETNVRDMAGMIEKDSISQKSLYKFIVNTFSELRLAKKDLRNVSGKDANFTALQQENAELRSSYKQVIESYTKLRQDYIILQRQ